LQHLPQFSSRGLGRTKNAIELLPREAVLDCYLPRSPINHLTILLPYKRSYRTSINLKYFSRNKQTPLKSEVNMRSFYSLALTFFSVLWQLHALDNKTFTVLDPNYATIFNSGELEWLHWQNVTGNAITIWLYEDKQGALRQRELIKGTQLIFSIKFIYITASIQEEQIILLMLHGRLHLIYPADATTLS
jgi:hypothetical protein